MIIDAFQHFLHYSILSIFFSSVPRLNDLKYLGKTYALREYSIYFIHIINILQYILLSVSDWLLLTAIDCWLNLFPFLLLWLRDCQFILPICLDSISCYLIFQICFRYTLYIYILHITYTYMYFSSIFLLLFFGFCSHLWMYVFRKTIAERNMVARNNTIGWYVCHFVRESCKKCA